MNAPTPVDPGATPVAERALAPDLARGGMLLLIALANVHVYLYGGVAGVRSNPGGLGAADRVVVLLQTLFVDGRAYPLFALLFGYGITQLARRRAATGMSAAVSLVRRRGVVLLLIGFTHGVLLWAGDISGAYGLLAVLLAGLLVAGRDDTLTTVAVIGITLSSLLAGASGLPTPDALATLASITTPDPLLALGMRVPEWITGGLFSSALGTFGAVALGAWAGRRRLLDDPGAHRRTLTRVATWGIGGGVLLGLPFALLAAEIWTAQPLGVRLVGAALHTLGGFAAGVGYAALFGLWAARISGRAPGPPAAGAVAPGLLVGALTATGRRSLSCYLAQSVAFVAFPAWGFGLGAVASPWQAALYAVGTWLVILLVAVVSDRAGIRGPAESLLRTLTYGRPTPAP